MNKKELSLISFSFIVLLVLIGSVIYLRAEGGQLAESIINQSSKILANDKKNFNDSKFTPSQKPVSYLDSCKISIKYDNSISEEKDTKDSPSIERTLLTSPSKKSGIDILCINMPDVAKQLKTILNQEYDKDNEETIKILGVSKEEFNKKSQKDIYQLYLIKNVENNCKVMNNLNNLRSVHSKLENYYSSDYIDCTVTRGIDQDKINYNYRYLFSKDEKFVLQLGEIDVDRIKNNYLVFKN